MQKRKFIGEMLVAAVIILLYAMNATLVHAGGETYLLNISDTDKFLVTTNLTSFTDTGYTIKFIGATDCTVNGVTYTEWRYQTNWPSNTASHIYILVPAGCDNKLRYYCSTDSITGNPVECASSIWGPVTSIPGNSCTQYKAIRYDPNTPNNTLLFWSEKRSTPVITTILGCKTGSCAPGANSEQYWARTFGPSIPAECGPPPFVPVYESEKTIIEGKYVKFYKNPEEECLSRVAICNQDYSICEDVQPARVDANSFPAECFDTSGKFVPGAPDSECYFKPNDTVFDCGDTEFNQQCRRCLLRHHGSPGCTTINSSRNGVGYAYTICSP